MSGLPNIKVNYIFPYRKAFIYCFLGGVMYESIALYIGSSPVQYEPPVRKYVDKDKEAARILTELNKHREEIEKDLIEKNPSIAPLIEALKYKEKDKEQKDK